MGVQFTPPGGSVHICTEQVQSTPTTASSAPHTTALPLSSSSLPRSAMSSPRSRGGSTSLFKRRSGSLASPTTTSHPTTANYTTPHVYDTPAVPVEADLSLPSVPTEDGGVLLSYIRISVKDTGHGISQVSVA